MIGYISGNLITAGSNGVIVLETGGIGYEITCSASAYELIVNKGKGSLFTYLNVREDGFYLYGFISLEEKSMFLKLITVTGVGPKMGITILSSMPLNELAFIIASQDVKSLSKVKGLGKKTAERIILELRENISKLDLPEKKPKNAPVFSQVEQDSLIALMGLGFSRAESEQAIAIAKERGADTIETIITIALQTIR